MSGKRKPPYDPSPKRPGCSLAIAAGGLIGLVLGGLHGIREYNAAVDRAVREDGFADYLPVGVPIWALMGATLGALALGLLVGGWRLVSRTARAVAKDEMPES
jgi:hypothetical protein